MSIRRNRRMLSSAWAAALAALVLTLLSQATGMTPAANSAAPAAEDPPTKRLYAENPGSGPAVAAEKLAEKKSRFFSRVVLPLAGVVLAGAAVYLMFFHKKKNGSSDWETNVRLDGSDALGQEVVGMWTFNGMDFRDLSAYGNHGRAMGNPAFVPGIFGDACSFNGTSAYVQVTEKGVSGGPVPGVLSSLRQGTISLWFKLMDYPAQIYPLMHFGSSSAADGSSLIIEIGHNLGGGKLYFTVLSCMNKVLQCYNSNQEMSIGVWHHFVAIVEERGDNTGFNSGYLDGQELTDRHYNVNTSCGCAYFFDDLPTKDIFSFGYGRFGMTKTFFYARAALDEVIIWNRVLAAADVAELYRRARLTKPSPGHKQYQAANPKFLP